MQEEFIYQRKITHTQYRHGDRKVKKGGLKGRLHPIITDKKNVFLRISDVGEKEAYYFANDKFISSAVLSKITPIWLAGAFLLLFLAFLIPSILGDEKNSLFQIVGMIVLFSGFLFFVTYYFTMPLKENIFNREDGIITFPGFMWYKNITMPVEKIIFTMSGSGSLQGGSAFRLLIERPDMLYTKYDCFFGGENCYQDLSFLLWYMDKNRPLPPGDAFDAYREQDFERRKAAGFPKPLFPSHFDTPEATPEQQAERKRIGGW